MRIRHAVAAGIVTVVAAIALFLLDSEPRVIGTNTIAPLSPVVSLGPDKPVCQRIPRVPAGAGFIRLRAEPTVALEGGESSSIRGIRITISDGRRRIGRGRALDVSGGRVEVPLERDTRGATDARLCVHNLDKRFLSLFGEQKKPFPRAPEAKRKEVFAVAFLQPESSSRLSRADLIVTRYGFGHAGLLGAWAFWLAILLALGASTLALWLAARDPSRGARSGPRTPVATDIRR